MSAEFRPQDDYDALLGGLSRGELFESLQDSQPPEDLEPLQLDPALAVRLGRPLLHDLDFPRLRRDVTTDLLRIVSTPGHGLDADRGTVYDLRQGLSEAVQNTFRNNFGVWQIDLKRTSAGALYTAVHNVAVDYPDGPILHERPGQRPLQLDRNRNKAPRVDLPDDEHGWGLGLIGSFALNGSFTNMGFYREEVARIPAQGSDRTAAITRLVFWSLYAKSELQFGPIKDAA
jgi:hypothetical protein